jgi:hypothetical protein
MFSRRGNEAGATAILVALMATMLFGLAAMSVDLGNAWARKRELQGQADLAALAGGAHLTADTHAEALEAVDQFLGHGCDRVTDLACDPMDPNWTYGQAYAGAWDLDDLDVDNGEVQFLDDWKMRVITPTATVDYGFAGVLSSDFDSVDLNADATVQIQSPGNVFPFFLLNGSDCSWGPQVLKAGPQSGNEDPIAIAPSEPVVWDPAGPNNNHSIETSEVRPTEWDVLTEGSIDVYGQSRSLPSVATVYFNAGAGQAAVVANVPVTDVEDITGGGQLKYRWKVTVPLPDIVRNNQAAWAVRVETVTDGRSDENSSESLTVRNPADIPDECGEKSTGDFGIIDSPRKDGNPADAIRDNITNGMDHPVQVLPGDPDLAPEECTPVGEEVLDDTANLAAGNTPNCLRIETGNKTDAISDGLVGDSGRLVADTTEYCQEKESTLPRVDDDGHDLNGDTLECFLESGEVDDIDDDGYAGDPVLSPAIFDSPRFMWVPVLNGEANPQAGDYPIVGFRPVFVTDLGFNNSDNKVVEISVHAFSADALPDSTQSPSGGIPYLGVGTRLVRLVE